MALTFPASPSDGDIYLQFGVNYIYNATEDLWKSAGVAQDFPGNFISPKTADPTLRDNGGALEEGDIYYNTVDDELRLWDGVEWSPLSTVPKVFVAGTAYVVDGVTQAAADGLLTGGMVQTAFDYRETGVAGSWTSSASGSVALTARVANTSSRSGDDRRVQWRVNGTAVATGTASNTGTANANTTTTLAEGDLLEVWNVAHNDWRDSGGNEIISNVNVTGA